MNKNILGMAIVAGSIAISTGAQASFLIDDFSVDTSAPIIVPAPGAQTTTPLGASSDFSDTRELTIGAPAGPDTANAGVFAGELGISTGIATEVDTTSAYANAAGFDFTTAEVGGTIFDQFVVTLTTIDQGGVDVTLVVNGVSSTQFVNSVGDVSFAHALFGNVSNVTTFDIEIHNNAAVDATFDSIASFGNRATPPTVPEPASLALLGLGLAGLARSRKAKKA